MKRTRARVTAKELELNYHSAENQSLAVTEMTSHHVEPILPGNGLFLQFGLMHLLAYDMPAEIETDFPVLPETQQLIQGMYTVEKLKAPKIFAPEAENAAEIIEPQPNTTKKSKTTVTFSGGKDSLWNLMRARKKAGADNTLAVHISGLNRAAAKIEREDSERQVEALGFALEKVQLHNGTKVSGHKVMRSRDMLLMALAAPHALGFGSSRMTMEGGWTPEDDNQPGGVLNEQYWAWQLFNAALKNWKIPVQAEWENRGQMDTVKDLAENWPEALGMASSCFSPPFVRGTTRKRWLAETPDFILDNPSQCGSCVKCRQIRLAQACSGTYSADIYDQIRFFLTDTRRWAKTKEYVISGLVGQEFWDALDAAEKRYA